jgi:hypothetical protein
MVASHSLGCSSYTLHGCRPPSGAGAAGDSDEDEDDEDGDPYLLPITHEVSLQCAQLAVSDECPRHTLLRHTLLSCIGACS